MMNATDPRPSVFIGSSSEGLPVAKAFRDALSEAADATVWHEGIFGLGDGTLESLVAAAQRFDFAVLVLTPDDLVTSRKQRLQSARDNVLFECGLFIGKLGRHRTFIAFDRRTKIKIPSDLAGITLAAFGQTDSGDALSEQIKPAAAAICEAIGRQGRLQPLPEHPWRPFVHGQPRVVLGRFSQFEEFEASGVLAVGDAVCLTELSSFTRSRYQLELPVTYADEMSGNDLSADLILVGGPDSNSVTGDVLRRVTTSLKVGSPTPTREPDPHGEHDRFELAISSGATSTTFVPEYDAGKLVADHGAILRVTNPFDRRRKALLLFGCFGFGTWASGRCVCSEEFLSHPVVRTGADIECVVRAEVVRGVPQQPIICELRELPAAAPLQTV